MGHIILLSWKRLLRNKANTFWILCFPIILGTFFNIAFSNLGESENIKTVSVAVVCEEDPYGDALKESMESIKKDGGFIDPIFCNTKDEAMDLLKEKEVYGILSSGEKVKLTLSAEMATDNTLQSIVASFVDQYNMYQDVIIDVMENHPEKMQDVINSMNTSTEYNEAVSISRKPEETPYTQYFYNLLAMTCLFTSLGGVLIATENQANLSTLGARKCISPTHKLVAITGEVIATTIYEFILTGIGFIYVAYVLRVDIVSRLPLAILAMFIGCLTGVSMGFFIGCIGKKSADFKSGMVFAISMPLCFLSGLMMGNMQIVIKNYCPILNKINPATLITDSFYSLSTYENFTRYTQDILSLAAFIILFGFTGFLLTRRQRYANL